MEISLYQMMFILGNAARTYIAYRFFSIFYKEEHRKKVLWNLILYICYFAMVTMAAFVNNPSPLMAGESMDYYTTNIHASDTGTLLMYVIEFAGLLAVTFFYERNLWKNILTSLGLCVIFRAAEAVVFQYMNALDSTNLLRIEEVALFRLEISMVLISTVIFTLVGIHNIRKGIKKTFLYHVFALLTPCIIGLFLIQILASVFYQLPIIEKKEAEMYFIEIPWYYMDEKKMILLFAACLGLFWLYDFIVRLLCDTYEKELLKKENQYYESRLKNMKQSITAWKKLRHDQKNHFIVLKGMLDSGEEEQAKTYLDKFIQDEFGKKREIQSGNMAIDSILNYKMYEAEQRSVTLDLDLQIPEQLTVSSQAMSVILGNAIDNAIEAAEKTENKMVSLVLQYTKGRLLIQISNPYSGELKVGKFGEYLTEKVEKEHHGLGLKSIKDTVEKSGGVMNIDAKEQKFTLTILLYL